ncbi:MAG TPA: hypothetical protein DIS93_03805 [Bdellovibrionales bacterium]|nr:hypothetical protein [Bdellovibrionales bacterium]
MKELSMKHWLVSKRGLAAIFAILVVSGFLALKSPGSSGTMNLGTVQKQDLIQRVTVAGTVNPARKMIITPPYNGYVKKLFVGVGDHVKAGDPIVSVSQTLRNPNEEVFPLRAPYSGTVVQVNKAEGEYVTQNDNGNFSNLIVRIDDTSSLFVDATTPEIEITKIKSGQEAQVRAPAVPNRTYKGMIRQIALAAKEQRDWDKSKIEFPIRIEILDPDSQIKSGMSVIVDVFANKLPQTLTLRHEFIQKDQDKYFAMLKGGKRVPIEVGIQNEEVFQIISGLKEGDAVMQADFLKLFKEQ